MNNIGLLIKMSRIQQNMKQVTLAKGICSTSYLSKIENIQTVPSDDVIHLLLSKLGVKVDEMTNSSEDKLFERIVKIYKEALTERNIDSIRAKFDNELSDEMPLFFKDSKKYYLYILYVQRIKLILDPSDENHGNLVNGFEQIKHSFDDRENFIFLLNSGLYFHLNKNYKKSLLLLEEALSIVPNFHIEDWEVADFYNVLSTTYLANNQLLNTIEYANKSLKIYKDIFFFNRAINSYIIIGVAHKRNNNYKYAEENFKLAKKISTEFHITDFDGIINNNLGSLMSVKGNSDLAIEYYFKSLVSPLQVENRLTTIFSIVQEYFKMQKTQLVINWCEKGLAQINCNEINNLKAFKYHFNLYHNLSLKNKDMDQILVETISYFEKVEDYRHAQKYSILLAEHYSQLRKYKNSSLYYQKANEYLYKIKSINTWEDL